jgi:hypothetical protein
MLDANLTFTGIINVPTPPLPSEWQDYHKDSQPISRWRR